MSPSGAARPQRLVRTVLVAAVVLLLLWGVDALARVAAQTVASRRIAAVATLEGQPEVRVRGALFLPQVVRGRYRHIDVRVDGFTQDGLRLDGVQATLLGVRVPFGDLVGGSVDRVLAERTDARAAVRYEDLNQWLQQNGRQFTVSAGADGAARLSGTLQVAGRPVEVGGDVSLRVEDGAVVVSPGPGGAASSLPFTVSLPVGDLPYGQQLSAVRPGPEGVEVQLVGSDVVVER